MAKEKGPHMLRSKCPEVVGVENILPFSTKLNKEYIFGMAKMGDRVKIPLDINRVIVIRKNYFLKTLYN